MNQAELLIETPRRRPIVVAMFLAAMAYSLASAHVQGVANAPLWEDRFDPGFAQAFAVAALKNRVFVSGFGRRPISSGATGRDFVVRAYDTRFTGSLLWQDTVDKGDDDFASGISS